MPTRPNFTGIADQTDRPKAGEGRDHHKGIQTSLIPASTVIDDHRLDVFTDFWRDVLCRVEESYAAAPASLLAYTAYASGNDGLANVALDRALDSDSGYSLAHLLRDMITTGMPPAKARLRMTPEELAALYADREQAPASAADPDDPHPWGAETSTTRSAPDAEVDVHPRRTEHPPS